MVYSGFYSLHKSNSTSTIKSEQSSSNLNNTNTTNTINNGPKHNRPKNGKKINSEKSSSKLSNNEDRFNDNFSNVTSKSDTKFKNCSPKLAPEIIFLIKEHAKTLETINLISKRLQEIEIKVDDMSQRLSKEASLNNSNNDFNKVKCGNLVCQKNKDENLSSKTDSKSQSFSQKDFNLNRYSNYKEIDQLSNNNSNNANLTNIPNNPILSDDSGGEYGNKTKTVSEDDELLSILDKITKCSHHILQTQQAHQNQTNAVYNSLSKQYTYNNGTNLSNTNRFTNQNNNSIGLTQTHKAQLNPNLNGQNFQEVYYTQNYHPVINPYMLNAKIPIDIPQQQNIVSLNYTNQQNPSLNGALFEPNLQRFLGQIDQYLCNDDTNLAAILNNNQQPTSRYINPMLSVIPMIQQNPQQLQTQSYLPTSPHHQSTSTPKKPINNLINRRNNCVEINNLNTKKNSDINSNYNLNNFLSKNQQHIDNLNYSKNNIHAQQFLNWQKSKELFELKERERIDNQLKQADEWLNNCLNQNKYQTKIKNFASSNGLSNSTNHLNSNLIKGDKNEILKEF